jgi:hypothetical protein
MSAESRRMLANKNDTFVDRIMQSVDRFYTHLGVQKQLRQSLLGNINNKALLSSLQPNATQSGSTGMLYSGGIGVGNTTVSSILGPGQYQRTNVPGSGGIRSRSGAGYKGYSFSKLERPANMTLPRSGKKSGQARVGVLAGDWKTDLAKSGAPISAQLSGH